MSRLSVPAATAVYSHAKLTDEQLKAHGINGGYLLNVEPSYPHSEEPLH